MLRKATIVFATAIILTAGLTAGASARGGGGHMGGGFGGGHIGGGFGGGHIGGLGGTLGGGLGGLHLDAVVGRGITPLTRCRDERSARSLSAMAGHFRLGYGSDDLYDYGCGYGYPYYNPYNYNCYLPQY